MGHIRETSKDNFIIRKGFRINFENEAMMLDTMKNIDGGLLFFILKSRKASEYNEKKNANFIACWFDDRYLIWLWRI